MKQLVLASELLAELAARHGTPLYVYDMATARARLAELAAGFDVVRYAIKANPNLLVLAALREAGAQAEAVSAGEVVRALRAGFRPEELVFSADLFEPDSLALVARHGLHVQAGSRAMLAPLANALPGAELSLRLNPGFGSGFGASVLAGGKTSKHGIWHEELEQALAEARQLGLRLRGLHLHLGSGVELEVAERSSAALAAAVRRAGPGIVRISAGGGLPIPYRAGQARAELGPYVAAWRRTRRALEQELGHPITLEVEPGRYLVAECGTLLTSVRCIKSVAGQEYVLVDAGFHTLLRPTLYGAWHEIRALHERPGAREPRVVAGPLCEPGDVFTREGSELAPRPLPPLRDGDVLAIQDAGAYGACMASRYNSRALPAEVVVDGGQARLARPRPSAEEDCASEWECLQSAQRGASSPA